MSTGDVICCNTASELVFNVLHRLTQHPPTTSPRGMQTRELRWQRYVLKDVTRCACWLPHRNLNYPFMFAELLWIFCGRDDLDMLGYYNTAVGQFSDDGKTFYGAYGPRWRGQIAGAVQRLRDDPDSRQAVVCTWRPEFQGELNVSSKDVPCTLTMQYLLRDGKLEAGVSMRSSDSWLGLPYDIFTFAMLQRAVAAELRVPPGDLALMIGSSHLYERNLPQLETVLNIVLNNAAPRDDAQRMCLVVPGPPGLHHDKVEFAEATLRCYKGAANIARPAPGTDWEPLLSMLDYRRHHDPALVHPAVRPLVLP